MANARHCYRQPCDERWSEAPSSVCSLLELQWGREEGRVVPTGMWDPQEPPEGWGSAGCPCARHTAALQEQTQRIHVGAFTAIQEFLFQWLANKLPACKYIIF